MRSMHAEMRALAAAAGLPDHETLGHAEHQRACVVKGEMAGVVYMDEDVHAAAGCPACIIAAHADAMVRPEVLVWSNARQRDETNRDNVNTEIRRAGYPLPLIPDGGA